MEDVENLTETKDHLEIEYNSHQIKVNENRKLLTLIEKPRKWI